MRGQLGATLFFVVLVGAVFTAVLMWWLSPLDYLNGRFLNNGFDFYGLIPIAWSFFAFAVGVLAGTVVRRVVPAMAATIASFATVRLSVEYLWRPRYVPAAKLWGVAPTDANPLPRNAWLFTQDMVAPHSHAVLTAAQFDQLQHVAAAALRANPANGSNYLQQLNQYLQGKGYTEVLTFQPATRFWLFQGIETAICLAIGGIAMTIAYRWVLRRAT